VNTQSSSILVSRDEKSVWVKVEGKGSFLNSGGLKEFASRMMERGMREFQIDLKGCPVMDSTFMGTLTGMALKLQDGEPAGRVHIVNLNDRNRDLLSNLGLDHLFALDQPAVESAGPADQQPLAESERLDSKEQAQVMLDAHEALVEAEPENIAKFKDVLEFLRQDIDGGK
jgi:anti-sigma B factor antagonist